MPTGDIQASTERFQRALANMASAIESAIGHYGAAPSQALDYACRKWKGTALRFVTADLKTVTRCLLNLDDPRNLQTLVVLATNGRELGKRLGPFNFRFAGPGHAGRLHDGVDRVVESASALLCSVETARQRIPASAL